MASTGFGTRSGTNLGRTLDHQQQAKDTLDNQFRTYRLIKMLQP